MILQEKTQQAGFLACGKRFLLALRYPASDLAVGENGRVLNERVIVRVNNPERTPMTRLNHVFVLLEKTSGLKKTPAIPPLPNPISSDLLADELALGVKNELVRAQ